jgi:DNA gyrase/topoisomerase IV subunit B
MKYKENAEQNISLFDLEHRLKSLMSPVRPDQKFIGQLRERLESSTAYNKQRQLGGKLLTIALGLLSGSIIFLVGRRFMQKPE